MVLAIFIILQTVGLLSRFVYRLLMILVHRGRSGSGAVEIRWPMRNGTNPAPNRNRSKKILYLILE
jgi:hypothetical protein